MTWVERSSKDSLMIDLCCTFRKLVSFLIFNMVLGQHRSTADLLTVLRERIARSLNSSGANRAICLDISKAFKKIWHCRLLHDLKTIWCHW